MVRWKSVQIGMVSRVTLEVAQAMMMNTLHDLTDLSIQRPKHLKHSDSNLNLVI